MARSPLKFGSAVKPAPPDWDAPVVETAAGGPLTVRVRCIVKNHPHTHVKGLALGEQADVPPDVAELMFGRGQIEYVG